jgi:hypothetical protein
VRNKKEEMNIYQDKIINCAATILKLERLSKKLSGLRLVAFVFSAIAIVILANERLVTPLLILAPLCIVGFALLIKYHNEIDDAKQYAVFLKEINEQEVLKQKNKLSGFPTGETFLKRDHAYASDLDIFGHHSLFQLINRTTMESAGMLLAGWLSAPAVKEVILARQKAVRELSPKVDWRQDLQATGMHFKHTVNDNDALTAWMNKPVSLLPHRFRYLITCILLSILSTAAAVNFLSHLLTVNYAKELVPYLILLAISLIINSLVLKKAKAVTEATTENVHHHLKITRGYRSLISKIESEKWQSEILQKVQSDFGDASSSAAGRIDELTKILEVFQVRGGKRQFNNFFYSVANAFWFLDIHLVLQTEKWKLKNAASFKRWASSLSEFEALSSLAGFHYANPSYTFPGIKDAPYATQFEMLGHPLISAEKRVYNTFNLDGRGNIVMITGSNMAGKSTFLRSVGVNIVLALMGAPCCARSAQVSDMKIFTSMRTQDNLEEGVSSFYAELRRIEQLLKLIESGQAVFFLLDEMFKGTNSKDRHKGGVSLIRQLRELDAFGIISTHDLELASMAGKHMIATNYSFNSRLEGSELIFNYVLTPGLCTDFNASELMKKSGIKILPNIEDS